MTEGGAFGRHELEQVVARAVQQLGSVRVDRLRSKLPKPYQRPQAELAAALGALADRREVFRHPTAKTTYLARDPLATLPALVLGAVDGGARAGAEIVQRLAGGAQELALGPDGLRAAVESVLQALVEGGQLFERRAGKGRGAVRYAREPAPREPGPLLRQAALAALDGRALTTADLLRRVGDEARSHGLSAKAAPAAAKEAVRALVAEGLVFEHRPPPGGRAVRYARAPQPRPALGPYLGPAAAAVRHALAQLAPFGVTVDEALRALGHQLGAGAVGEGAAPPKAARPRGETSSPGHGGATPAGERAREERFDGGPARGAPGEREAAAPNGGVGAPAGADAGRAVTGGRGEPPVDGAEAERCVLMALDEIAAGEPPGSIIAVARVRARAGLPKAAFDRSALALAEAERVALHYYDHPFSMTPAERDELVRDEEGTYYIRMARRRGT
jgi:hypothetical protein